MQHRPGWDTYLRGHGQMRGKLLGLVPVARGSGPEFDVSELVTWLNDAVLVRAPWVTPVTGWQMIEGRPLPTGGNAVWKLPEGSFHSTHIDIARDKSPRRFSRSIAHAGPG